MNAQLICTSITFDKGAILLILNGGFDAYQRGDVVMPRSMHHAKTTTETLCMVITPAQSDKPNWFQCLMSFIFGDKK